jgi:hypothetical protein
MPDGYENLTATKCRQMAERSADQETRGYWLRMEKFWLGQCRQDGLATAPARLGEAT